MKLIYYLILIFLFLFIFYKLKKNSNENFLADYLDYKMCSCNRPKKIEYKDNRENDQQFRYYSNSLI